MGGDYPPARRGVPLSRFVHGRTRVLPTNHVVLGTGGQVTLCGHRNAWAVELVGADGPTVIFVSHEATGNSGISPMVPLNIESMEILLLIAAVVAMVVRRLRLPYTVALVLTGAAMALGPAHFHVALTKQLIFTAFLPPLIFEAALQIEWRSLKREVALLALLVTFGVAASAGVVAAGLHAFAGWPWTSAILLGVLISATDPVSVIATFKDAGVQGRLRLLVEAESLLNDGTAAVLFAVALAAIAGGALSATSIGFSFLATVLGGVICGGVVAGGLLLLAGHTDDHLVEITLTVVAVPSGGALPPVRRAGDDDGWHLHGQRGVAGILYGPRARSRGVVLGIHHLRGELPGVSAHRDEPHARELRRRVAAYPADNPAAPGGTRTVRVWLLRGVHAVGQPRERAPSACAVLGRAARRPGSGPGAGPARWRAEPYGADYRDVCRGGVLGHRSGAHDDTAPSAPRRVAGCIPESNVDRGMIKNAAE